MDDYKERVSYGADGNIMSYVRHGYGSNIPMDSLTYHYWDKTQNNRLEHINDGVTSTAYTNDLKNQSDYNYQYNKNGNVISDGAGGVGWSKWNVYGKITNLYLNKSGSEDVTELDYLYDPNGNRLQKDMHYGNSSTKNAAHEWYVRDAQGNVMAVYTETNLYSQSGQAPLILSEQYIYGSSRIGVIRRSQNMDSLKAYPVSASLIGDTYLYQEQRGNKFFELSNHLGNVLVTVSDKKFGHVNGSTYDYYNADVVNATDYYPFGMEMPNRTYSASNSYRYGFNGKENDNEVKGEGNQQDYGMRIYDPRVGRFLSVDPLSKGYPYYSPYQFAGNMPIAAIDIDGLEQYVVTYHKDQNNKTTKIEVRAIFDNGDLKNPLDQNIHRAGDPNKEKIALGNVLVFEIKKNMDSKETMTLVDKRNKVDSKLTTQEANIFKTSKANLEKETPNTEDVLTYGTGRPTSKSFKILYESQPFENSTTQTFNSKVLMETPPEKPKIPQPTTEIKVGVVTLFTPYSPGENQSGTGHDMKPLDFAKSMLDHGGAEYFKKKYKVDSIVLDPNVHYNLHQPPPTIEKLDVTKIISVPKNK